MEMVERVICIISADNISPAQSVIISANISEPITKKCSFDIYSGAKPLSTSNEATGTLLCAALCKTGTYNILRSGVAGYFRISKEGRGLYDGTIATAGGDLILRDLHFVNDGVFRLEGLFR